MIRYPMTADWRVSNYTEVGRGKEGQMRLGPTAEECGC